MNREADEDKRFEEKRAHEQWLFETRPTYDIRDGQYKPANHPDYDEE